MNHSGTESFTLACTRIRLLDNSNGILRELFPEMKRTAGEGFRASLFLLACWASTCMDSERRKIKRPKFDNRTRNSIASPGLKCRGGQRPKYLSKVLHNSQKGVVVHHMP